MSPDDVIKHWGGKFRASQFLEMNPGNITYWLKKGYIPISTQYEIARKSDFELVPDTATHYCHLVGTLPLKPK